MCMAPPRDHALPRSGSGQGGGGESAGSASGRRYGPALVDVQRECERPGFERTSCFRGRVLVFPVEGKIQSTNISYHDTVSYRRDSG